MIAPNFDLQIADLFILLASMITFLGFLWASKKLLDFMGLSDMNVKISAMKEIKREDHKRRVREVKANIRKENIKKEERKKRVTEYFKKRKQREIRISEKARIRESTIRREKFNSVKNAVEQRQNELIKQSRREELHRKINSRVM